LPLNDPRKLGDAV